MTRKHARSNWMACYWQALLDGAPVSLLPRLSVHFQHQASLGLEGDTHSLQGGAA